ncbi:MAG: beta-ketoacyl synthase N-terminal-like domain-containing protein, partial [Corynebacterium sp.]|nr:beta-ketoacyl synthase N-terminal-like domain-containing protein [Corynebacterium sp.]
MDQRQMTVAELKAWLRAWVVTTTGLPEEEIADDKPMEAFGLSSRDVVVLSGELENLLQVQLDATIAYEYPSIAALSRRLIEGPSKESKKIERPEFTKISATPGTHDIAIIGMAARYPKAPNLKEMWELLVTGRDGITELPEGRWSEYSGDDVMSAKMASVPTVGGYL